MKVSDLRGRQVVSLEKADKIGEVDHVLLDLQKQQAVALKVKPLGFFTSDKILSWSGITSIGEDAVTIQSASLLQEGNDAPLSSYPSAASLSGSKVMTQDGQQVGSVGDVDIDIPGGQVTAYLLSEGLLAGLTGKQREVPTSEVVSVSQNMLVVQNQAVRNDS